jgi:RND superfamily putative drug exporter
LVLALPYAFRAEESLDVSTRLVGAESTAVEEALATRFHSPLAHPLILVLDGVPSPETAEGLEATDTLVGLLKDVPGVRRTLSYKDTRSPLLVGAHLRGSYLIVGVEPPPGGHVEDLVPSLRKAVAPEAARLRERYPGAALLVTGAPAINYDLWRSSMVEARRAEARSLPLTLGLLLLAFGSLVAAAVPLVVGVSAVTLVLGGVFFLNRVHPLSILIVNVASMLGLSLGIDYALLTVSRFREALRAGASAEGAAEEARKHAGATVLTSGVAVIVGFLALFLVPLNELRSCALGGLLVVFFAVALSKTLVPPLLRVLAQRIGPGRATVRKGMGAWERWACFVSAHPAPVLLVTLVPLLLLASETRRLSPRIPEGHWLPEGLESTRGIRALEAMGRGGIVQVVRVVLEFPEGTQALSEEGWAAVERLSERLQGDDRVASVQFLGSLLGERSNDLAAVSLIPGEMKRAYLSDEGDAVLLEAVPREGVDPRQLLGLVSALRGKDASSWTGLSGSRLRVGGLPAFDLDYEGAVAGRLPWIVGLVVLGSFCALFRSFRSVLIPLKAVALNLLSVGAAFGALVLVFQRGFGLRLLGLTHPLDGVFPIVPPLVFCTVFGLSMDYEVFLVSRVREARLSGRSEVEALAEGLGRTAGLITSAASVMVTVFLAFTLGDEIIVKMLGFTLATAVFLDATLVRTAVGPALLRLAGRWNWWPGDRPR